MFSEIISIQAQSDIKLEHFFGENLNLDSSYYKRLIS